MFWPQFGFISCKSELEIRNLEILENLVPKTSNNPKERGGGVLRYMGYIGPCGPKGYGFWRIRSAKKHIEFDYFGLK